MSNVCVRAAGMILQLPLVLATLLGLPAGTLGPTTDDSWACRWPLAHGGAWFWLPPHCRRRGMTALLDEERYLAANLEGYAD